MIQCCNETSIVKFGSVKLFIPVVIIGKHGIKDPLMLIRVFPRHEDDVDDKNDNLLTFLEQTATSEILMDIRFVKICKYTY